MSKILVTGGAGFVGSTVCKLLKEKYPAYTIVAFDNLRRRGAELNINPLLKGGIDFIHGDIRNREDIEEITDVDVIIDASADPAVLAGISSSPYPVLNANLTGTINCLELASKQGANFIFLSTSRIYPITFLEKCMYEETASRFVLSNNQSLPGVGSNGLSESFPITGYRSFYGASKLASELLIAEYNQYKGVKTVINRCGVISGPGQMGKIDQGVVVLWLARHYFKGKLNYIGYNGQGKQTRDVMHVNDLFDLIDWQIHNIGKVNGETFNVGGGNDISFSLVELTDICRKITGNKIEIGIVPDNRTADIPVYITDYSKIADLSGWRPKHSVKDIVQDIYTWLKNNENALKTVLQ